jgi:hypothetical protein
MARALRMDMASAINSGKISAGSSMLASGMSMPVQTSTVNSVTFNWSRIAFAGGAHTNQCESNPFDPRRFARTLSHWIRKFCSMGQHKKMACQLSLAGH